MYVKYAWFSILKCNYFYNLPENVSLIPNVTNLTHFLGRVNIKPLCPGLEKKVPYFKMGSIL